MTSTSCTSCTQQAFSLSTICEELGDVETKWFKIGIQLGVPRSTLQKFQNECDPLSAVLDYCLRGNVTESIDSFSWNSIVKALRSKYVGEPGLAEYLCNQYCQPGIEAASSVDTVELSLTEGDAPSLTEVSSTDGSIDNSATAHSPFEVYSSLDPKMKLDLEFILEQRLKDIIAKYASYVDCLCKRIEMKTVSAKDLQSYLMSLSATSLHFQGQKLALLSDKNINELQKCDSVKDIFDFLSTECASFLSYDIFQLIVEHYSISIDDEKLKYPEHLQVYMNAHKASEFAKVSRLLKIQNDSKELILKFDIKTACRLAKVDELKKLVAEIMGLSPSALSIIDIKESYVVTFAISTSVADSVFASDVVLSSQQEEQLRALSVLWIKCNSHTFNLDKKRDKDKGTSQSRPTLSKLKRVSPQDLAHCDGYVWHLGTKIGKGSFGEVYLGWTNDGSTEVAVKVVRKEFFKQDPKVRENLEREIRIFKLLRGCEYVVQILHVQELTQSIVIVLELCEYDLDHLVKIELFREDTFVLFLYQLAQCMKALRNQNIVHRDLKPGNILIKSHPTTKKMVIKLADFGFARHFKDESRKAIDMTSLAGTPVFMAPEALSCVFHPGEHYDDKVDIWSIGALLYKVIVGPCGFYAQLQDIPRILKHKGDAIAFERTFDRKINYIYELPASINDRFSESFRVKMTNLLCSMLKLDPRERMTFTEFFETVDDMIHSKIEVVNILHGTTVKVLSNHALTADVLIDKVRIQWHVPSVSQVIFSTSCSHYIAPHENLSQPQVLELLDKSGGSEGHAKLFMLPHLQFCQSSVPPDTTCLTPLKYTVDDEETIVSLITEQKFSDEIVHMIRYMGSQQSNQLEGLEELATFTLREMKMFMSSIYPFLLEQLHQDVAKASLALTWLKEDAMICDNTQELSSLVSSIENISSQLQQHLLKLADFSGKSVPALSVTLTKEDISKTVSAMCERAKKLHEVEKDQIQAVCNELCKDCIEEIARVTQIIQAQLKPFADILESMWSMRSKTHETCSNFNQLLDQVSLERLKQLRASTSGVVQDKKAQAASNHVPVVTPPPLGSYLPTTGQSLADPSVVETLRKNMESLHSQLCGASEENSKLKTEVLSLELQLQATADQPSGFKVTQIPSQVFSAPTTSDDAKILITLAKPDEYSKGDNVLFTPLRTVKSKSTIPALLHLQRFKPHILLDPESYANLNIRPGRMPELLIARLLEGPRKMNPDEHKHTAKELGDASDFYFVMAESVALKFSTQRMRSANSSTLDLQSAAHGFKWKPKLKHFKSDKDFI